MSKNKTKPKTESKEATVTNGVNKEMFDKNGKLKLPTKQDKKTEDKKSTTKKVDTKIKPPITVDNFRDLMKDKPIEFSNTKDGWLKIKVTGKKIISYMKQGKIKPGIIMWNNLEKRQQHIKDKKELNNYIKSVDIFIKG